MRPIVRIERHAFGPRCHILGRRIHEWHLGVLVAVAAIVSRIAEVGMLPVSVMGVVAVWLVAKDWRDVHPATRDTACWSLGLHRPPDAPPAPSLTDRVPALAALATAVVGAVNIGSAMTAEMPGRVRHLLTVAPDGGIVLAHALALPAGLALVAAAYPLWRRRRRALRIAVATLVALGVLNVMKGLDVEEATVSLALAGVLWRSRQAFWVTHEAHLGRALLRAGAVLAATPLVGTILVAIASPWATQPISLARAPRAALNLLALNGTVHFHEPFHFLPMALGLLGVGAAIVAAATLLAPMRPRRVATAMERHRAAALVRRHGSDTLSAFKLRSDLARRWSDDGRAMAAYKIEAGTLLLAGDPVGAPEAIPGLLRDLVADARRHGLAFGCVGASEAFADEARRAGVHRMYLGDEAILSTGGMDLSGGAKKSLRKAVNRVARNGFTAELRTVGDLEPAALAQLQDVSDRWREGDIERGFSMAHDVLVDELLPDAQVVLGRDESGQIRGFLHFVPVFGRPAVSLGFMRRDRDTPNGLMDFLVVEGARLLGEQGVQELSLNFASYGRWLREPANIVERALAVVLRRADSFFQIERLLRFNQKFDPRWQPRYLLFERPSALPRVGLASMLAEGQLPRLSLRRENPTLGVAALSPARA